MMTFSCKKDTDNQKTIDIPNGDFEQWDNMLKLISWQTNSCPACVPPYDPYVIKQVTDSYHGQYAAKFIYNNVFKSKATNKFAISMHPTLLTGYLKSSISYGDTIQISIDIFLNHQVVDSGRLFETLSTTNYNKFEIPITSNSNKADSALIKIIGGGNENTEFIIDYLNLIKK